MHTNLTFHVDLACGRTVYTYRPAAEKVLFICECIPDASVATNILRIYQRGITGLN